MFEVLATAHEKHGWADLTLALNALEHRTGPRPDVSEPARALTALCLAKDTVRRPYALLSVARLPATTPARATATTGWSAPTRR
ncbi:hypothetical protein GCM10010297_05550 [Streptomyces malachitofuscus]|nr:hypothetical protein GCM10010297_05550 [Streptomyces malachitofuscus]